MIGYVNKISDIEVSTDNPETYSTADLRRAIRDAYNVYQHGNKSYAWYEQVWRICNEVIEMRGELKEAKR